MSAGPERNFSLWRYHERLLDDLPPVAAPQDEVVDGVTLTRWQEAFRQGLGDRLGGHQPIGDRRVEVDPVPVDVDEQDEAFVRHRVVFRSEPHLDTPAWLLVPRRQAVPGPAVLAVHGHGPDPWIYDNGRDLVAGPAPRDPEAAEAVAAQCPPFGAELARAGFVVLAPDLRGFGERWDRWPEGHRMCDHELAQQLALGRLPMAGNVRDLVAALDVLSDHPLVDAGRIGAAGFSFGGTLTLVLAALDERVTAAVVSGAFSDPRAAARVPFDICGAQVLPGLVAEFDHVQLAAAIAPRALRIETGDDDHLWPAAAARAASGRAAALYERIGAPDRFVVQRFAGGHRWDGDGFVEFLTTHLGP